jgi:hypothetical protein
MADRRGGTTPGWRPAFLPVRSRLYRLEFAVGTLAILGILFGWRMAVLHEFPLDDVLLFVLFLLLPDLVAFIPMALARAPRGMWPAWGPPLYNVMHSLLTWAGVFLVLWIVSGNVLRPLLGWAAHITLGRAMGYHLRAPVSSPVVATVERPT